MTSNHDIRALVEQAEERFEKRFPDLETHGQGKRSTIRSMAFKEVADTLQLDVKTVRQKWRRAGLNPRQVRGVEKERFDYLGVPVTEAYRRMLKAIHGSLKNCSYALSTVKANMTKVTAKYPVPDPLVQRVLGAVEEAAELLRGLQPCGICPWCKNVSGIREKCATCHSAGWLPTNKRAIVPLSLRHASTTLDSAGKLSAATDVAQQAAVPDDTPAEEALPWET